MYEYSQALNQLDIGYNHIMGEMTLFGVQDNDKIEISLSIKYESGLAMSCSGYKMKSNAIIITMKPLMSEIPVVFPTIVESDFLKIIMVSIKNNLLIGTLVPSSRKSQCGIVKTL